MRRRRSSSSSESFSIAFACIRLVVVGFRRALLEAITRGVPPPARRLAVGVAADIAVVAADDDEYQEPEQEPEQALKQPG